MAIIVKSVDESIYKDIIDLEYAYDMIKKLEEINQEANENFFFEKLIKQLKIMVLNSPVASGIKL